MKKLQNQKKILVTITQVIDFPTFLLHVLAIWEGKDTSEVQLDDKKLLTLFDIKIKMRLGLLSSVNSS